MSKLPLEILLEICSYCDISSLKKARLVSSIFASAASPWLFEEVWIALFPESLVKLLKIAGHPVISKYVKSLIYLGEFLESYTTMEHWEKQIDNRPSVRDWLLANHPEYYALHKPEPFRSQGRLLRRQYQALPKHTLSPGQKTYHFERYQHYVSEQRWLYHNTFGFDFLRVAFGLLKNLNRIQMSTDISKIDTNTQPIWRRLKAEILVGPRDHRTGRRPTGPCANGIPQLIAILWACEASRRPLKSLDLGLIAPDFWPDFSMMEAGMFDGAGHRIVYPFQNLRVLLLDLENGFEDIYETRTIVQELGKVIGRAKQVEILHINVREGSEDPDSPFDFLEFAPKDPFPVLQELKISLPTRECSLMRLLKANSSSLRSLSLIEAELLTDDGGTWRSVIRQLPQILTLNEVYLECLRDSEFGADNSFEERLLVDRSEPAAEYEKAIDNYVLHGGSFPTLEPS